MSHCELSLVNSRSYFSCAFGIIQSKPFLSQNKPKMSLKFSDVVKINKFKGVKKHEKHKKEMAQPSIIKHG
jgi:hypothetical protein